MMIDINSRRSAFEPDPERDRELAALLEANVGRVPNDAVDWNALALRISSRVSARAALPWWGYAASWERRVIPIALAAGIVAMAALWNTEVASAASVSPDLLSAVVEGAPQDDAVRQIARSITSTAVDITAGEPE